MYNVRNYVEPLGFVYENVWAINLGNNQDTTDIAKKTAMVFQRIKAYAEVESATQMNNELHPFSTSNNGRGVTYKKRETGVNFVPTDENFARTMFINTVAGKCRAFL